MGDSPSIWAALPPSWRQACPIGGQIAQNGGRIAQNSLSWTNVKAYSTFPNSSILFQKIHVVSSVIDFSSIHTGCDQKTSLEFWSFNGFSTKIKSKTIWKWKYFLFLFLPILLSRKNTLAISIHDHVIKFLPPILTPFPSFSFRFFDSFSRRISRRDYHMISISYLVMMMMSMQIWFLYFETIFNCHNSFWWDWICVYCGDEKNQNADMKTTEMNKYYEKKTMEDNLSVHKSNWKRKRENLDISGEKVLGKEEIRMSVLFRFKDDLVGLQMKRIARKIWKRFEF